MLVYSTTFDLQPSGGLPEVRSRIPRWLGEKIKGWIDPEWLSSDFNHTYQNYHSVSVVSSVSDGLGSVSITYAHPDSEGVEGRDWVTEIGLSQRANTEPVRCTVLLRTNEMSAMVAAAAVTTTRPAIVSHLLRLCSPSPATPGIKELQLDVDGAAAFKHVIEDDKRTAPVVVVSATNEGGYLVDLNYLRTQLTGLADLVVIPQQANTFAISKIVGARYTPYAGAICLIFEGRFDSQTFIVETRRVLATELSALESPEGRILALVTHRTNLPRSWQHITPDAVRRDQLQKRLAEHRAKAEEGLERLREDLAKTRTGAEEIAAVLERTKGDAAAAEELTGDAWHAVDLKESELADTRSALATEAEARRKAEAKCAALHRALEGQSDSEEDDDEGDAASGMRAAMLAALTHNLSLLQCLALVRFLYPQRLHVLGSADDSAKESASFRKADEAFELMMKLAGPYWDLLSSGSGDDAARKLFGNAFSAKESDTISKAGVARRTFPYQGKKVYMERHLKIGVKDSVAETFRLHFHWDGTARRIVIGHCGKHLDF